VVAAIARHRHSAEAATPVAAAPTQAVPTHAVATAVAATAAVEVPSQSRHLGDVRRRTLQPVDVDSPAPPAAAAGRGGGPRRQEPLSPPWQRPQEVQRAEQQPHLTTTTTGSSQQQLLPESPSLLAAAAAAGGGGGGGGGGGAHDDAMAVTASSTRTLAAAHLADGARQQYVVFGEDGPALFGCDPRGGNRGPCAEAKALTCRGGDHTHCAGCACRAARSREFAPTAARGGSTQQR
jgi:hypothetical protein